MEFNDVVLHIFVEQFWRLGVFQQLDEYWTFTRKYCHVVIYVLTSTIIVEIWRGTLSGVLVHKILRTYFTDLR